MHPLAEQKSYQLAVQYESSTLTDGRDFLGELLFAVERRSTGCRGTTRRSVALVED